MENNVSIGCRIQQIKKISSVDISDQWSLKIQLENHQSGRMCHTVIVNQCHTYSTYNQNYILCKIIIIASDNRAKSCHLTTSLAVIANVNFRQEIKCRRQKCVFVQTVRTSLWLIQQVFLKPLLIFQYDTSTNFYLYDFIKRCGQVCASLDLFTTMNDLSMPACQSLSTAWCHGG